MGNCMGSNDGKNLIFYKISLTQRFVNLKKNQSALSGAPKVAVEHNGATAGGQIMAVGGGS